MKERILTKEDQMLVLETKISERESIISAIQSEIAKYDKTMHIQYRQALLDQIIMHDIELESYKEENKLK